MAKHDYHWTFGKGCHIAFTGGGDPVLDAPHNFSSNEGCAAVSDGNGNLLFYTNGNTLYDGTHTAIASPPLGGTSSSCHAAIIVPPAGAGSLYHVFTVGDWDGIGQPNVGPVHHSTVSVAGGIAIVSGPTPLVPFGPARAAEKLAAIPHTDCSKYWVVSLGMDEQAPDGNYLATFYAMLVDSDSAPTGLTTVSQPYPHPTSVGYSIKFSPDGTLLAISSIHSGIDFLNFDRTTGAITPHSRIVGTANIDMVYGIEFSPNGKYVYFTGNMSGYIRRHTIVPGSSTQFSQTDLIGQWNQAGSSGYRVGALQLAPNGKIYGVKVQAGLFEIGNPDAAAATAGAVAFNATATAQGGGALALNGTPELGLPTFTRIADDCADRCAALAAQIDATLFEQLKELKNGMLTCEGRDPGNVDCAPLDIPRIQPKTYISWGDSKCDCIESDDTEIMYLTVCNPYSNLTLSNVTVYELVVVDDNGQPVATLPDGTPSIQLVPLGPYCFDDIAPCACITRQFVLRLRGAIGGRYRILVRGICFDACFHGDGEACFAFDVCKD